MNAPAIFIADAGAARYVLVTGRQFRSQLRAWGIPAMWLAAERGLRLRREHLADLRARCDLHGVRLIERVGAAL